jgi:hypothetical protein
MRTTQIVQTPLKILMMYTFNRIWRVIWVDGRELPKDPEPRWYGYSVGKWVDDTTLVVETNGLDERTWIDRAGRPHSSDLRVEERFQRVDHDHLEMSVTINDPQMYTKPWVAMNKMRFELRISMCASLFARHRSFRNTTSPWAIRPAASSSLDCGTARCYFQDSKQAFSPRN